mmetsp:Transcript_34473/g.66087  ORF Transcript_34473/g.66087 Transcript_34473/m.66087 type:complete len:363 (-) Transcript_34473:108-1196(-)
MLISLTRQSITRVASQSAKRSYSSTSPLSDRIVVAVGGNALQRRGERLTIENMLKAAADMAPTIAKLASEHELVLTHGNGPQVGELALERSAATFDVLGAESMGQIGYVLAQALSSAGVTTAPIICQVVVDPQHEAFRDPSKFVGPIYGAKEATALSQSLGWVMKPDGEYFRRVVPSPPPKEILQVEAIASLLENTPNVLPIACGGGGIPVSRVPSNPRTLQGVEAVIDKDACGAKLATELNADGFIILTDGGGIWQNYGKPGAREMKRASPEYLLGTKAGKNFPGSMGPKIQAAIDFVTMSKANGKTEAWAAIGDLKDAAKIFSNEEGTVVKEDVKGEGVVWRESRVAFEKKQSKDQHKSG